jgi:hypothetical protein
VRGAGNGRLTAVAAKEGGLTVVFVFDAILLAAEIGDIEGDAACKNTAVGENGNGGHIGSEIFIKFRLFVLADAVQEFADDNEITAAVAGFLN